MANFIALFNNPAGLDQLVGTPSASLSSVSTAAPLPPTEASRFPDLVNRLQHIRDLKLRGPDPEKVRKKMYATIPLSVDPGKIKVVINRALAINRRGRIHEDGIIRHIGTFPIYTAGARGPNPYMEDTWTYFTLNLVQESAHISIPYLGLFDGHGGLEGADFMEKKFHQILLEVFGKGYKLTDDLDVREALKVAFVLADIRFREAYPTSQAGTTALIAILLNGTLFLANAGDSRAILSRKGQATPLTLDAIPTEEPFKNSIEKRDLNSTGLFVFYKILRDENKKVLKDGNGQIRQSEAYVISPVNPNVVLAQTGEKERIEVSPRVCKKNGISIQAGLAPARTIGDRHSPAVSPRPKVTAFRLSELDETEDNYLILASDGVWDVLDNTQVAQMTDVSETQDKPIVIAQKIRDAAYSANTGDNVTVMVIEL